MPIHIYISTYTGHIYTDRYTYTGHMYTDRYTHTLTYKYMRKPGDLLCNVRYSPSSHTRVRRTYGRYMRNGEQSKVTETEMEMEIKQRIHRQHRERERES